MTSFMNIEKNNNKDLQWHEIDWRNAHIFVSKLQKELVVAYNNNDMVKVYDLQMQLMFSFSARALAVRRVTTSSGGNTSGIDGIVWKNSKAKMSAINKLRDIVSQKNGMYKAGSVRRTWVTKTNSDQLRPLGIPNLFDRALQALVLLILDPIAEEISDVYSFGSRKFRSAQDAIQKVRSILDKPTRPMYVWVVDVEKCFDEISHEFINRRLENLLCIKGREFVEKWLKASIVDNGVITHPVKGTPQGSVISPLLCNITFNGLEEVVRPGKPSVNSTAGKKLVGFWIIRYMDDFLITSPCLDSIPNKLIPKVKAFLAIRGLSVSESKSKIVNLYHDKFNFLGWTVCLVKRNSKYNKPGKGKLVLVIKPRNDALTRIKRKIKVEFSPNKPIQAIIKNVNPIIRGWCNYFKSSYHSQQFFKVLGHYIFKIWWSWAKNKHRKRNAQWIYKTYVFPDKKRSWRMGFNEKQLIYDPTQCYQILVRNLRNGINPYVDPDYYTNRKLITDVERFRKGVYEKHKFKCPYCTASLYGDETIVLYLIVPESKGGTYSLKNTLPLHETCRDGITSAGKDWAPEDNSEK
jgi:RNA-directed DNA polymerase